MIGFYLTTENGSHRRLKLLFESFDPFVKTKEVFDNSLYILSDHRTPVVRFDDYTFFVIGTLIYKNQWSNDALKLIAHDLSTGMEIKNVALNSRGQYCLVIYTHENVFIITDKLGSFPIYRYEKDNSVQVSNIFPVLSQRNSVTLDFQGLAEFISLPEPFCFRSTFFKEIQHLCGGTIYQFGKEQTSSTYYDMLDNINFGKHRDLKEISSIAEKTLTENLSFLGSQDKVFVDTTGGFDTRVVATILNGNGIGYVSGICGEQVLGESQIAKEVARRLGVEFHDHMRIQSYEQFKDIVNKHYGISNGVPPLYHTSELINYYVEIGHDHDIHVTGFGGTELLVSGTNLLTAISSYKTNIDEYLRSNFEYVDIIDDRYMTKDAYYDKLYEKVGEIIGRTETDDFNNLSVLLKLTTYSRYYHGAVIGTHNCIMSHYSPYLEANFVKIMLETSPSLKCNHDMQKEILSRLNPDVASVMTTHGYTASTGSRDHLLYVKRLARQIVRRSGFLIKIAYYSRDFLRKIKRNLLTSIGYLGESLKRNESDLTSYDRPFWVQEVESNYSDDMTIFEIVDQGKFEDALHRSPDRNRFMAKIVYLNKIIEEYNPMGAGRR